MNINAKNALTDNVAQLSEQIDTFKETFTKYCGEDFTQKKTKGKFQQVLLDNINEVLNKKEEETKPVNLPFSTIITLAQRTLQNATFLEQNEDSITLRDAILKFLMQEFITSYHSNEKNSENDSSVSKQKQATYSEYYKLFCFVLNGHNYSILNNMHLFRNGSRLKLLLNSFELLSVELDKVKEVAEESDLKKYEKKDKYFLENTFNVFFHFHYLIESYFTENEKKLAIWEENIKTSKENALKEYKYKKLGGRHSKSIHFVASGVKLEGEEKFVEVFRWFKRFQIKFIQFTELKTELEDLFKILPNYSHFEQLTKLNHVSEKLTAFNKNFMQIYESYYYSLETLGLDSLILPNELEGINLISDLKNIFVQGKLLNIQNDPSMSNPYLHEEIYKQDLKMLISFNKEFKEVFSNTFKSLTLYINQQVALQSNHAVSVQEQNETAFWMQSITNLQRDIESSSDKINQVKKTPLGKNSKKKKKKQKVKTAQSSSVHKHSKEVNGQLQSLATSSVNLPKVANNRITQQKQKITTSKKVKKLSSSPPKRPSQSLSFHFPVTFDEVTKSENSSGNDSIQNQKISLGNLKEFFEKQQVFLEVLKRELHLIKEDLRSLNMDSEVFYEMGRAIFEIEKHGHYTAIGMKQLFDAIETENTSAVGLITPNLVFDLFIQQEQLIRFVYIKKFQQVKNTHDLVILMHDLEIFDQLPADLQKFSKDISLATYWVRYPNNYLRCYHAKNIELPLGLKMIKHSQQLLRRNKKYQEKTKNIVLDALNMYRLNTRFMTNILQTIQPQSDIRVVTTDLEQSVITIMEQTNDIETSSTVVNTLQLNEISEITVLKSLLGKIENLEKSCFDQQKTTEMYYLKEAFTHLQKIIKNIELSYLNSENYSHAWLYRNLLNAQLIFESLYTVRYALKKGQIKLSHDLSNFHQLLQDKESLNASAFSFNKSFQYSSSYCYSQEAQGFIKVYQQFENRIDSHCETLQEEINFKEQVEIFMSLFSSLLEAHLNECGKFFSS